MPGVRLQNEVIKKITNSPLTDQDGIVLQSTDFYKDSSNRSLREEGRSGDGVTRPGLRSNRNKQSESISYAFDAHGRSAVCGWISEDDTLRDTCDIIVLAKRGGVK